MKIEEVKEYVKTSPTYADIWENPIILLSLGGSYAYGTNTDNSDIDLRGIMHEPVNCLLGLSNFEQKEIHNADTGVDTVVYGFKKMINLLLGNNPNCIEILSPQRRNIVYSTELGDYLIEHRHLFLSQKCVMTFGAYARAQLDRLQNAMCRDSMAQAMQEEHMLHSILGAIESFNGRFQEFPEGNLKLKIVDAINKEYEKEIVLDVNLKDYPLRDYKGMWSEMQNIVKDYSKLNGRNRKKDIPHLCKHMMHLVRLYLMGTDILEKEEIITYRENDIDLLMSIRNGDYMEENGLAKPSFYELVDKIKARFEQAVSNTRLPKKPNFNAVENLVMEVNRKYIEQ